MTFALNLDKPDFDINCDLEAMPLCHAINCFPGLQTTESCSGHDVNPLMIFFKVNDFRGLSFLVRCIDRRYCQNQWKLELSITDTMSKEYPPVICCLSTYCKGNRAYKQAKRLIENFEWHLNLKTFMKLFNLQVNDFDCLYYIDNKSLAGEVSHHSDRD